MGQLRCPKCSRAYIPPSGHREPTRLLDRIESFSSRIPTWLLVVAAIVILAGFARGTFLYAVHVGEIKHTPDGWRWAE